MLVVDAAKRTASLMLFFAARELPERSGEIIFNAGGI